MAIIVHEHYCLQVKCVLVLHLISAAYATAALGLMSKHLPYRQDSYHCEHCRRLELHAVVLSLKPAQHFMQFIRFMLFYNKTFSFTTVRNHLCCKNVVPFSGSVAGHVMARKEITFTA